MDGMDKEKLVYLLNYLEWCIEQSVYDVLSDGVDCPEHSAVTTQNLIKCYINIASSLEMPIAYRNVEEFLKEKCFTSQEIEHFEECRAKEAVYYIGKQY